MTRARRILAIAILLSFNFNYFFFFFCLPFNAFAGCFVIFSGMCGSFTSSTIKSATGCDGATADTGVGAGAGSGVGGLGVLSSSSTFLFFCSEYSAFFFILSKKIFWLPSVMWSLYTSWESEVNCGKTVMVLHWWLSCSSLHDPIYRNLNRIFLFGERIKIIIKNCLNTFLSPTSNSFFFYYEFFS